MTESVDFKSDFIILTKNIASGEDEPSKERDIALQLNLILSMFSLPIELTKFKKRNAERRFFEPLVNFLKENSEISVGADKKDRYIVMDLKDAIAHLHIVLEKENDEIKFVILSNEFHNEVNFLCKISTDKLQEFVLLAADEYEKYCDKINLLSNR